MPIYKINESVKPVTSHHLHYQQYNVTIHSSDSNYAENNATVSNEIQKKEITFSAPKAEKINDHHKESETSNGIPNHAGLKKEANGSRSRQETIVEKEIRRQLEKEREIQDLHSMVSVATTNEDKKEEQQTKKLPNGHEKFAGISSVNETKSLEFNSNVQDPQNSMGKIPQASQDSNVQHVKQKIYKKSVVHPFEDVENDLESKLRFIQPQSETVIEKEIRLAKQREGSLRKARGFKLQIHQAEEKPKVTVPLLISSNSNNNNNSSSSNGSSSENNRKSSDSAVGSAAGKDQINARRLATNRLKQEILKEKQREVDLMKLGKVQTLSEERAALDISIIEELVAKELEERKRLEVQKNCQPVEKVAQVKTQEQVVVPSFKMEKSATLNVKENPRTAPLENIKYNETHLNTEARIEEEIKEIKKREQELRDQRAQSGLSPTATSPLPEQATVVTSYRRR